MFSNRAVNGFLQSDISNSYSSAIKCIVYSNTFDPASNTNGYINAGIAVNYLQETELENWLNKAETFQHEKAWQHYYQFRLQRA